MLAWVLEQTSNGHVIYEQPSVIEVYHTYAEAVKARDEHAQRRGLAEDCYLITEVRQ